MRSKDSIVDVGIWRVTYRAGLPNEIQIETFDGEKIPGNKWGDDVVVKFEDANEANLMMLLIEEAKRG